ncbi:MAG TPA: SDR family oxidoreductase [Acidimicrobiia bacterium]|nr:SDR family oxidoreductase [Acidimicrobiia bacterium]
MELRDAGAIVTGGASGIGAACVAQLAAAGARVAVLDVQPAPTAELGLLVDVGDPVAVGDAVAQVCAAFGRVDVAVLAAGVGGHGFILDLPLDEWDRVMNVNLRGAFITLQACARAMTTGGAIVAITSISGALAERGMAHYAASKAALAQLVRSAARELGPRRIRVNAIAPGVTQTPMFHAAGQNPRYREQIVARTPLGDIGAPDAIAAAVVALCRLEWVTGQVVAADGGVSLHSPIDPHDRS